MNTDNQCPHRGKKADEECREMMEIFKHYDRDKNGLIDAEELRKLVDAMGDHISEEELKIGLSIIDKNKNGKIEFREFVNWWKNR
jgi:calmodulin